MAFGGSRFGAGRFAGSGGTGVIPALGHGYIIDFAATNGAISDRTPVGGTVLTLSPAGGYIADMATANGAAADRAATGGHIRDKRGDE